MSNFWYSFTRDELESDEACFPWYFSEIKLSWRMQGKKIDKKIKERKIKNIVKFNKFFICFFNLI